MKKKTAIILFLINLCIVSYSLNINAGGALTTSTYGGLVPAGLVPTLVNTILFDYAYALDNIFSQTTDSFNLTMANTTSIGDIKIKRFTIGANVHAASSVNLSKPVNSAAGGLPSIGGGANASVLFGMSLGKKWDLLFSASYVPYTTLYDIKFRIFSGGTTIRYSYRKKNASNFAGYQGLSIALGGFFSYNNVSYKNTGINKSSTYDTGVPIVGAETGILEVKTLDFSGKIYVITADIDVRFYFKVFYILNLFASVGGSINFSYLNSNGLTEAENTINGVTETGNINFSGKSYASKITPKITGGFELNLVVRILVQGNISWTKGNTLYGATCGFRFQF
jgi:hypothetical protein